MVLTFSSLCREPLAIGEEKAEAAIKSGSEPAQEASKAQAANPAPEPTKAAKDAAGDSAAPSETSPLVANLEPRAVGGGDDIAVEAFEAVPRPHAGDEGSILPLPSSAVVKSNKDDAMAMVMSSLPSPRQATLKSIPPFSGSLSDKLDASGHFPLAVLAEKRAKEQLADITLLRSSVEYALANAAREVAMLKRELEAAKGSALVSFLPLSALVPSIPL